MTTSTDKRKTWEAMYLLFQRFALDDQRLYYRQAIRRARAAATEVNTLRAVCALLTGVASALAGLLVAAYLVPGAFANGGLCAAPPGGSAAPGYCGTLQIVVGALAVTAIVAPALGAAFSTLGDLYQWDRQAALYESALENLEVADAESPIKGMDDAEFRAALRAYAEGALSVMRDETAQWGQIAKPPPRLEEFLAEERRRAAQVGGDAGELSEGRRAPDMPAASARPEPPDTPPLLPES